MKKHIVLSVIIISTVFLSSAVAQNVGISTANPLERLDVNGNIYVRGDNVYFSQDAPANANNDYFSFDDTNGLPFLGGGMYHFHCDGARGRAWNQPSASISARGAYFGGRVGIETLSPTEPLHVNGNARIGIVSPSGVGTVGYGNRIYFSGGGGPAGRDSENSDPLWMARFNIVNDQTELRMTIGDNSQVGDAFVIGFTNATWNPRFRFQMTGDAFRPGGGTWATLSDVRTKKNIKNFTDGLEVLKQINPVTFQYNGKYTTVDDGQQYIGIIAQDVEKVAPYMIDKEMMKATAESTTEEILNYDGGTAMIYLLVNSVKEQQKTIEALQRENKEIRAAYTEMNRALQTLKKTPTEN
ncbi:MAG: tail fiber domain-containing protein [Aureispira sp.]